jgi:SAM-dependent methyltransferase
MIENKQCLACGSDELISSLNLGMQPLANNLTHIPNDQDRYPLAVNLCKSCYHLQLTHTVDPAIIYSNYLYVSGTSQTLKEYSEWFAGYVNETITLDINNVLDIGCNDGTQLNYFKELGFNTFGIDPARNIYPISSQNHNIVCDYFGPHIADSFNTSVDAITAQNVFAHNPNPIEFLQTCKKLMSSHTKLYIQTSQADMVLNNEFDTIYHEHVNFFNINSMNELAKRAGINLIDVVKTPIHGNSYIFVLSLTESKPYHIQNLIDMEHTLTKLDTYIDWEENVKSNMSLLKSTIEQYRSSGFKIIGYGAAAKGNTLLNYIDTPLDLIIDDSPLKQNLYAPGTCSPIKSIDSLNGYSETDRILFIPLAWNFFTEISQRIRTVRNEEHDVFLKYFPKVYIA